MTRPGGTGGKNKIMNKKSNVVTVNGKKVNVKKYDLALRLAQRVLSLPAGSWPETEQAGWNLEDALPKKCTKEEMIAAALIHPGTYIHPDRKNQSA